MDADLFEKVSMVVVIKYVDYMDERTIQVIQNKAQITVDLNAQCMHYYSSSPTDPILPSGMQPMYRVQEIQIPRWLIEGVRRGQQDGRYQGHSVELIAARILRAEIFSGNLYPALRSLAYEAKGKFKQSLCLWFAQNGFLTERQISAVLRDWTRR